MDDFSLFLNELLNKFVFSPIDFEKFKNLNDLNELFNFLILI